MVGTAVAVVLALVVAVCGSLGGYTLAQAMVERKDERVARFAMRLELAGIRYPVQTALTAIIVIGFFAWFMLSVLLGWGVAGEILALPFVLGVVFLACNFIVSRKIAKMRNAFFDQLEIALRLMSGGVRVGLSLAQAMTHIVEEMHDPARSEFRRVIAQTRFGVELPDALDTLAERMEGNETLMFARVIRVQRQTGGNLSMILDRFAETIKDRRVVHRKIQSLTAEGRIGALVLEALPVGVGGFVLLVEHPMAAALTGTLLGHIVLAAAMLLEFMAIFTLNNMLKVEV